MSIDSLLPILYLFLASSLRKEFRHEEFAKSPLTQSVSHSQLQLQAM